MVFNYWGTNLSYGMLYEPIGPYYEDKQGDNLSSNCFVNLKTDNKHREILVHQKCAKDKALQIKIYE